MLCSDRSITGVRKQRRPADARAVLFLLVVLQSSFLAADAFSSMSSYASKSSSSSSGSRLQAIASLQDYNEFSRKVATEKILGARQRSASSSGRDYQLNLQATLEECTQLALRFSPQIQSLSSLQASLSISPAIGGVDDVYVQGNLEATLTQTCVRTNQVFETTLQTAIGMTVRPVRLQETAVSAKMMQPDDDDFTTTKSSSKSSKKQTKKKKRNTSYMSVDDMDVSELQRMVQSDILDAEEDIMEDEAIWTYGGMLDAGELVSQVLWLSLDPYPKKPGSEWMPQSITG
jgi:uncharacterized metal-binding protein YceD (DUF177 family)